LFADQIAGANGSIGRECLLCSSAPGERGRGDPLNWSKAVLTSSHPRINFCSTTTIVSTRTSSARHRRSTQRELRRLASGHVRALRHTSPDRLHHPLFPAHPPLPWLLITDHPIPPRSRLGKTSANRHHGAQSNPDVAPHAFPQSTSLAVV